MLFTWTKRVPPDRAAPHLASLTGVGCSDVLHTCAVAVGVQSSYLRLDAQRHKPLTGTLPATGDRRYPA